LYDAFGGAREGIEAAAAIDALCEASAVGTLLSSFILPLQGSNLRGRDDRVHCSLNINTETGRLSARRPNLQNQPALEKDRYGIRKAFTCRPGNSLIVADYGQLELRLLVRRFLWSSCWNVLTGACRPTWPTARVCLQHSN
jgi:DNA polymerase-1